MGNGKNKVIVWRPFPSPTNRDKAFPPIPTLPGVAQLPKAESEREKDEAAVNRWIELADLLNGKSPTKKGKTA